MTIPVKVNETEEQQYDQDQEEDSFFSTRQFAVNDEENRHDYYRDDTEGGDPAVPGAGTFAHTVVAIESESGDVQQEDALPDLAGLVSCYGLLKYAILYPIFLFAKYQNVSILTALTLGMFLVVSSMDADDRSIYDDDDMFEYHRDDVKKRIFIGQVVCGIVYFGMAPMMAGAMVHAVAQKQRVKSFAASTTMGDAGGNHITTDENESARTNPDDTNDDGAFSASTGEQPPSLSTLRKALHVGLRHYPMVTCLMALKAAGIYGIFIFLSMTTRMIHHQINHVALRSIFIVLLVILGWVLVALIFSCTAFVVPTLVLENKNCGLTAGLKKSVAWTWQKPHRMIDCQARILGLQQLTFVLLLTASRQISGIPYFYQNALCLAGVTAVGPGFVHVLNTLAYKICVSTPRERMLNEYETAVSDSEEP